MQLKLPSAFVERMKTQLADQFEPFMQSYERPRFYGLRVNSLKIEADWLLENAPFTLSEIAWASGAFYYLENERPGKHPYYHAGLYYIQEPSAMAPAELLDVKPGDVVLDLCAAPGGKSTQIAAKLAGDGLLISNDQSAERTRALVKNLELFGVSNAIVLNELPHRIAKKMPGFFNKILVDAPCSGEGMFRKDEDMWREWSEQSIEKCVLMQTDILRHAATMLKAGGTLVYSTCTFAPAENEQMVIRFLAENPDFKIQSLQLFPGFVSGQTEGLGFTLEEEKIAASTIRLWPHLLDGEGHFVAVLRKADDAHAFSDNLNRENKRNKQTRRTPVDFSDLYTFLAEQTLLDWRHQSFTTFGEHVYLKNERSPDLDGLKVVRPGMYLGMLKKNRFEPAHALALHLQPNDVRCYVSWTPDDEHLLRYLRGETIEIAREELNFLEDEDSRTKLYVLVCVDSFSLGWGKWQQGILKNEYPQSWRRLT